MPACNEWTPVPVLALPDRASTTPQQPAESRSQPHRPNVSPGLCAASVAGGKCKRKHQLSPHGCDLHERSWMRGLYSKDHFQPSSHRDDDGVYFCITFISLSNVSSGVCMCVCVWALGILFPLYTQSMRNPVCPQAREPQRGTQPPGMLSLHLFCLQ